MLVICSGTSIFPPMGQSTMGAMMGTAVANVEGTADCCHHGRLGCGPVGLIKDRP